MSGLAGIFGDALWNVLRSLVVDLAGWVIVLGIILVCGVVVNLLLRLAGIDISFRSGPPLGSNGHADVDHAAGEAYPDGAPSTAPAAGGRTRRFRRGPLSVSFESQPQVIHIDQQMLDKARRTLATGSELDDTCRAIHPAYAGWDPLPPALWRRFAEAVGCGAAELDGADVWPETGEAIAGFRSAVGEGPVVRGLAALYAYESMVPAVAAEKIRGLAEHYGVEGSPGTDYFEVHRTLDVEHAASSRELLERYVVSEADLAEAERGAEMALDAVNGLLDGIRRVHGIAKAA